jgi:opacity protein-like surface antigen
MQIGRLFYMVSLITLAAVAAHAQQPAAQHSLSVAAGIMDFDLSGTGQSFVAAVRATRALTDHVAVEVGGSFAKPDQQFGPSTVIAPDVHLQYHWRIGRVRPYAGGGVGFAHVRANLAESATDFTWSGAGGVRVDVTDRAAVMGEMRVRGIEVDFAGSIAEWVGGLTWRLGR